MPSHQAVHEVDAIAGADLSAGKGKLAVWAAGDTVVLSSSAQGAVDGVITQNAASGRATKMAIPNGGILPVMAGAAVSALALVATDTSGRAITWVDAAGNQCIGRALEAAGAAGEFIRVQFSHLKVGAGS